MALDLANDGGDNRIWRIISAMVQSLGIDGMSTDCMSTDCSGDEAQFPASVVPKEWRSSDVIDILQHVDRNYNPFNGYGNIKGGTAPHARKRLPNIPASTRKPLSGLPINFYHPVWYQSLTEVEKRLLDAQPMVQLPNIVKAPIGLAME